MSNNEAIAEKLYTLMNYLSQEAEKGNGAAHIAYIDMRSIYDMLDVDVTSHPRFFYPKAWSYFRAGEKINAIRCVREQTGLGLAEAKQIVDNWIAV